MNLVRNSVRKTDEKHKIEKQKTLKPLRVEGFHGRAEWFRCHRFIEKQNGKSQLTDYMR